MRDKILDINSGAAFEEAALEVFHFQAQNCAPYKEYIKLIGVDAGSVYSLAEIPYLPIEIFKTHEVYCGEGKPQMLFTSSSTTGIMPARHFVADISLYEESFTKGFELFYGNPENTAIFALLPNYLERKGSSLIYMFDKLIKKSAGGGFYLHDFPKLIEDMQNCDKPKILLGVTYALLDLAEQLPVKFRNTVIMETGGMKGYREELPKEEMHKVLCDAFGVKTVHSEYGMAELLSQAYSKGGNVFSAPPWMKITIRDINDPFEELMVGAAGGVNIIDLANLYSCSFIQTQDMGIANERGDFRILGRITKSEIRGCNLLIQ